MKVYTKNTSQKTSDLSNFIKYTFMNAKHIIYGNVKLAVCL